MNRVSTISLRMDNMVGAVIVDAGTAGILITTTITLKT